MTPEQIVEQIMTMHWDLAACPCWVCEEGRKAGCHPRSELLNWRGKVGFIDVAEVTPGSHLDDFGRVSS